MPQDATEQTVIAPETVEKVEVFVAALKESGYGAMNSVCPQVTDGMLCLKGRVSSYYHKQVAQEAV